MARYWITPTARSHLKKAISDTREKWGTQKALKYRPNLQKGFQKSVEHLHSFHAQYYKELAEESSSSN